MDFNLLATGMKAFRIVTMAALCASALSVAFSSSAIAQDFTDMLGQEQIDRGTMNRNRRSRGQTTSPQRTPSNRRSSNGSSSNSRRSIVTYGSEGTDVLLGVIELVNGTVPREREALAAALGALEWKFIPSGLEVTPTGNVINDKIVPVRVNSTGQTGVVLVEQLRVVE